MHKKLKVTGWFKFLGPTDFLPSARRRRKLITDTFTLFFRVPNHSATMMQDAVDSLSVYCSSYEYNELNIFIHKYV